MFLLTTMMLGLMIQIAPVILRFVRIAYRPFQQVNRVFLSILAPNKKKQDVTLVANLLRKMIVMFVI